MPRIAFKMHLHPGNAAEYKKRHDEIWQDLVALLKNAGISEYSIFLDEETNTLFAILNIENTEALNHLPMQPIMQHWWAFMKDIMATNADNSPVSVPMKEVFYLP